MATDGNGHQAHRAEEDSPTRSTSYLDRSMDLRRSTGTLRSKQDRRSTITWPMLGHLRLLPKATAPIEPPFSPSPSSLPSKVNLRLLLLLPPLLLLLLLPPVQPAPRRPLSPSPSSLLHLLTSTIPPHLLHHHNPKPHPCSAKCHSRPHPRYSEEDHSRRPSRLRRRRRRREEGRCTMFV